MSILIPKTVCVSCGAFYHTQTALCMVYYSQNRLCMVKLELLYTTDWSNGLEQRIGGIENEELCRAG